MLHSRVLVTLVLLPIGLLAIYLGGPVYVALVALILALAAWELFQLFCASGYQPAGFLIVGGSLLVVLGRAWDGFASAAWMLSLLVLVSMAYHLVAYERGRDQAASDFMVTLSGALYIGWLGAYLISIRALPDGLWWLLLVLPTVWLADSAAYFIGQRFGRRKLTPRLSPKKTWEGYLAGIVAGTLGGALLGQLWSSLAGSPTALGPLSGAILGLLLSVLTTLGDLGESMIKRQSGMKDSGKLLPGHGGMFDRIDSWLWAAVIGYYAIAWLFM
ncbi:MAG TPA: CDP-archaeol synthase [Anaerolineales bacterium]|nr:CDP-archaeol synthase [Anaerolineales bacterium]